MIPVTLPPEVQPQAMAAKPKDGFWQFAVFEGIDTTTRDAIVADALRLITGHRNAFPPKMNPKRVDAQGLESYVWHTLRATEPPAGSGTGGSAPK